MSTHVCGGTVGSGDCSACIAIDRAQHQFATDHGMLIDEARAVMDVRCDGWPDEAKPCGWRSNQEINDLLLPGCPECGGQLVHAITGETIVDEGDVDALLDAIIAAPSPEAERRPSVEQVQTIYFYYDADGHLLYLGVTGQAHWRARQHNRTARWWPLVARAEFWHFRGPAARDQAYAWERRLIRERRPLWNIADNPNRLTVEEAPF